MKKLILSAFVLTLYFTVTAQSGFFTKTTPCGFEFTLSKTFVKSKYFGYYSNSQCFDTVLSNKDGVVIEIEGQDLSREGRVSDSIDYAGLELYRYKEGLMHSDYEHLDSVIFCSFNNIKFGTINYHLTNVKSQNY